MKTIAILTLDRQHHSNCGVKHVYLHSTILLTCNSSIHCTSTQVTHVGNMIDLLKTKPITIPIKKYSKILLGC